VKLLEGVILTYFHCYCAIDVRRRERNRFDASAGGARRLWRRILPGALFVNGEFIRCLKCHARKELHPDESHSGEDRIGLYRQPVWDELEDRCEWSH
jgi:hypothetical protein